MDKKVTKMMELIFAACCYSIKYDSILAEVQAPFFQNHLRLESLVVGITYSGFLFLISIFALSAISGEVPKGIYVMFFNICGAVLYTISECVLYNSEFSPVLLLSVLMAVFLALILVLDCFDLIF